MDDCRAAAKVADALVRLCGSGASGLEAVDVGSLEVRFQRTFGKFESALPEFAKINDAAYWDYQRSKVYARTDKAIRRDVRESESRRKNTTVEKEVTVRDAPSKCPKCGAMRLWTYHRDKSHIVYDLKFTRRGIKRWAVRYHYNMHRCSECRAEDDHLFARLAIRPEPASLCGISSDRITPLVSKGDRACVVAFRCSAAQFVRSRNQVTYSRKVFADLSHTARSQKAHWSMPTRQRGS